MIGERWRWWPLVVGRGGDQIPAGHGHETRAEAEREAEHLRLIEPAPVVVRRLLTLPAAEIHERVVVVLIGGDVVAELGPVALPELDAAIEQAIECAGDLDADAVEVRGRSEPGAWWTILSRIEPAGPLP